MQIEVIESVKGRFGPQIRDKDGFLSFGKFYKGQVSFEPGTTLEVDLFKTEKGNRYINSLTVKGPKVDSVKVEPSIPKTEVEKPAKKASKAIAFGRELSDYELAKDRRIGVAGVVQAVISSEWYAQQSALTDLSNKESVAALRDFAKEEAEFWLNVIREKSE